MIGNITKGKSFLKLLQYLHQQEGAHLIGGSLIGDTPKELADEFRRSQALNPQLERAVCHISLSVAPGIQLDDYTWTKIARAYLKEMGFEHCSHVAYLHTSTAHQHLHIVVSRIRESDGKTVSDSQDYRRSKAAIRKLERDFKLPVLEPTQQPDRRRSSDGELRQQARTGESSVWQKLQSLIDQIAQSSKQLSLPQIIDRLQQQGVSVRVGLTPKGVPGISYQMEGVAFSGSQLGAAYSFAGLQQRQGVSYRPQRDDNAIRALMVRGIPSAALTAQIRSEAAQQRAEARPAESSPPVVASETGVQPAKQRYYQQLWQDYSQRLSAPLRDSQANNPVRFDALVARQALEAGETPQTVALMLKAGSPYVQQLYDRHGLHKTANYINQTVRAAIAPQQQQTNRTQRQLEL